ncbi:MAG: PDZ domain-containing protein, partial [Pedobacter sp.]
PNKPVSGAAGQLTNNGTISVSSITRNSAAWVAGLNVNDEIISLDNISVNDALANIRLKSPMLSLETLPVVSGKNIGDVLKLKIKRDGLEKEISLTLKENPSVRLKATINQNATPAQKAVFKKWTGK